jgi:AhpD family alkylhydroperoxidase
LDQQFLESARQPSRDSQAHLGEPQASDGSGALEPLVKEMIYLAVSTTNGCEYCIRSHSAAARKAGMSAAMLGELMAVVGMANETNRLANGYQVEVDAQFMTR